MAQARPALVDAGDRRVARSILVNAPADTLFAMIANPHRHHEFDGSGTVLDRAKGPERLSVGDTFVVHMKMFGLPYTITSTATEVEPGRVIEWKHPGGHRWRYALDPVGPTQTRVTETFDYRASRVAKVFEVLGIPAKNGTGIERTLENLARSFR